MVQTAWMFDEYSQTPCTPFFFDVDPTDLELGRDLSNEATTLVDTAAWFLVGLVRRQSSAWFVCIVFLCEQTPIIVQVHVQRVAVTQFAVG